MTTPFYFRAILGLTLLSGLSTRNASAQLAEFASAPLSPAQRAAEYRAVAAEAELLERQSNLLKRVVRLVTPSVVHIEAPRMDTELRRSGEESVEEAGSGVVIELHEKFYILTNRHVVKESTPQHIRIKLADGRLLHPKKMWSDRGTDIAVLAIEAQHLAAAVIGNSDRLEIGEFVFAVGSPFGLSHSVSYGIISAKGRRDLELGDDAVRFQDFLQTDAAINPGNSGGPLLNLRGEVIGINTAIASSSGGSEGIGFTIPINMALTISRQLIENGAVTRAFLGVHLDAKFSPAAAAKLGLNRAEGARISGITPGSPAAAVDLEVGDVILEYEGTRIEDDGQLVNLVSLTPVEKDVSLTVFRDGRLRSIRLRVGDRGRFEPESR